MKTFEVIRRKAQAKLSRLEKMRADPRFKKVVGRLAAEKLLFGVDGVAATGRPTLEDALWAGEIEPRILELLPAILVRRPGLFLQVRPIPHDLTIVLGELKHGKPLTAFRGVPPEKYAQWIEKVAYRGKRRPGVLKAHRFTQEDLQILDRLQKEWKENETGVLRRAIRVAAERLGRGSKHPF